MLSKNPFNVVSIKVHHWCQVWNEKDKTWEMKGKCLGWHTDITWDIVNGKAIPCPNNSQVPGTITGLLTHGNDKCLEFGRGTDAKKLEKDSLFEMHQTNNALVALETRDE